MNSLIGRIRERIADGRPCDFPDEWLPVQPPVSLELLDAAEARLGFPLPVLLRRLYVEVGNGGYGPVFGLLPLSAESLGSDPPVEADCDLVGDALRIERWNPVGYGWRRGMVPVFYCGCNVFECVDCLVEGSPIVPLDFGSKMDSVPPLPSLESRLECWLAGETVW